MSEGLEKERQIIGGGLLPKKPSKEIITESIETTVQEMDTIETLKNALSNYLLLDDIYEYEDNTNGLAYLLGRLEMSLIKRKQALDIDREALSKL